MGNKNTSVELVGTEKIFLSPVILSSVNFSMKWKCNEKRKWHPLFFAFVSFSFFNCSKIVVVAINYNYIIPWSRCHFQRAAASECETNTCNKYKVLHAYSSYNVHQQLSNILLISTMQSIQQHADMQYLISGIPVFCHYADCLFSLNWILTSSD